MLKRLLDDNKHTGITGIVAAVTSLINTRRRLLFRGVSILAERQSSGVGVCRREYGFSAGGIITADYPFKHHSFSYDLREMVE